MSETDEPALCCCSYANLRVNEIAHLQWRNRPSAPAVGRPGPGSPRGSKPCPCTRQHPRVHPQIAAAAAPPPPVRQSQQHEVMTPAPTPVLIPLTLRRSRAAPPNEPPACCFAGERPGFFITGPGRSTQMPSTSMSVYSGNLSPIFSRPLSSGSSITHAASTTCARARGRG